MKAQQHESDLGYLTNPKPIADRGIIMGIDIESKPVRLAGPTGATARRTARISVLLRQAGIHGRANSGRRRRGLSFLATENVRTLVRLSSSHGLFYRW